MKESAKMYIGCIEEVRYRIEGVRSIGTGQITTGHEVFDKELVFIQLRKALELIAFSSLIANEKQYSAAHANFAQHWRAKDMLKAVEKLNADFYPVAIQKPKVLANGTKYVALVLDGFLTKDDFVFLYDACSEFMHTKNPFGTADPVVRLRYSVRQWAERILNLISLHFVHLVDGSVWIFEFSASTGRGVMHVAQPT
jgi:hypothetical protein